MAKHIMLAGTTSRREYIFIQDSSSTVGAGRTGLTNLTAGWKVYYVRPGAAPLSITLSAAVAATAAYSSTSFSEVDATNLPGVYRFDIPDAVFAAGADKAILMLSGPTNVAPVVLEYQLTAAGEAWVASGVWQAQLATYATVGTNEVFGTDTYGTKIARTVAPNRPFVVNTNNGVTVGGFNNNAIVAGAFATDSITANAIATDAITSAELSTTAVDEIVNSVWANATRTITGTATGAITSTSFAADAIDSNAIANSAITIRMSGDGTASEGRIIAGSIANDVWNALIASYVTANTFGARIVRTRSTSPSNEVTITGAFHIASDVHELQTAVIEDVHFADSALVIGSAAGTGVKAYLDTAADEGIADALLNRNIAGGGNGTGATTDRTVRSALRALRNKSEILGSTLTVYIENDADTAWTAAVTTNASANPVTGIDPAGP